MKLHENQKYITGEGIRRFNHEFDLYGSCYRINLPLECRSESIMIDAFKKLHGLGLSSQPRRDNILTIVIFP